MNKKIFLTYFLVSVFTFSFAQKKKIEEPAIAVYKLFADTKINLKDSVAIYALNFELQIKNLSGKTVVTNITANDSLAFTLFPMYSKLVEIDFSSLMRTKNNMRLVIPVLIYGNSPDKQQYKDAEGNSLINFNAAVNATFALYNPIKYDNIKESRIELFNLIHKASKNKSDLWDAVIMNPIWIDITHIK